VTPGPRGDRNWWDAGPVVPSTDTGDPFARGIKCGAMVAALIWLGIFAVAVLARCGGGQ
jgi:hypothetical protein